MASYQERVNNILKRRRRPIRTLSYMQLKRHHSIKGMDVRFGYDISEGRWVDFKFTFKTNKGELMVLKFSEITDAGIVKSGRNYRSKEVFIENFSRHGEKFIYIKTRRGYGLEKRTYMPYLQYLFIYSEALNLEKQYEHIKKKIHWLKYPQ